MVFCVEGISQRLEWFKPRASFSLLEHILLGQWFSNVRVRYNRGACEKYRKCPPLRSSWFRQGEDENLFLTGTPSHLYSDGPWLSLQNTTFNLSKYSVPSAAGHQRPERVLIIKKQVNESNFRGRKYHKMESVWLFNEWKKISDLPMAILKN